MFLPRLLVIVLCLTGSLSAAEWQPVSGKIMTRWAKDVSPTHALPDYPRPQMTRERWQNLNGLWDYAITPLGQSVVGSENTDGRGFVAPEADGPAGEAPHEWQGKILVPFCIESALSGVGKNVGPDQRLWYRQRFSVPADWKYQRVLLHFGAVDWHAEAWLNGKSLGEHRGGFDPFTFDLTDSLKAEGDQELVVAVWDPSNTGVQPCGKQHVRPHGIFYMPVTGIWQTVWIEPVPKTRISQVTAVADLNEGGFRIKAEIDGDAAKTVGLKATVEYEYSDGGRTLKGTATATRSRAGEELWLSLGPNSKSLQWTPEHPYLFNLAVELTSPADEVIDHVVATAALRTIAWKKGEDGFNRLFLNDQPVFQYGPLDQGWWPDGLYTAPTDEALKFDIEMTKKLGFNMCRKHVKVEPARWYHWCDQLGLLVWQDMPSGDRFIGPNDPDITRTAASEEVYRREWTAIVDALRAFPCIVIWVPFNEGWGQFKTNEILDWTRTLDATRLVDGPSGWADREGGDMHDMHSYPGPGMFPVEDGRVSVLGEFGGLGLPVDGHTWLNRDNWGYRSFDDQASLGDAYAGLIVQMPLLIGQGLSAAIYTQTTDVEVEVNGLMTYDREIVKFDVDRLSKLHARLHEPPPTSSVLVPSSEDEPQSWRFTTDKPKDGWSDAGFDDSAWKTGPGGFGTKGTPGTRVRTEWNTPDIWCRREFTTQAGPGTELAVRIHHDEDADVYLNGKKILSVQGYIGAYTDIALATAGDALAKGKNVLAVHCRQTGGGQYIDVGLLELKPATETPHRR